MSNSNSLVIYVIRAKELRLKKHKGLNVYVSLSTSGNSKWKSKVSTNQVKTTDGMCEFGEHCEFQLTEEDTELHIFVNYKTVLGTTESLGQIVFDIEQMTRYHPPTWFRLTKKNNKDKEYGFIQLEYQFDKKMSSSISSLSLNKIEGEKKFEKLKRMKMLIGKSKKATTDEQSMASVSLSRKSSFSSSASALAFSSPSPNRMGMTANDLLMFRGSENQISSNSLRTTDGETPSLDNMERRSIDAVFCTADNISVKQDSFSRKEKTLSKELNDSRGEFENKACSQNNDQPKNITSKVRLRAEQLLNLRKSKQNSDQIDDYEGAFSLRIKSHGVEVSNGSRPSSIASSSGFASLGSNNLGALNESTSTEHLLSVIKHLRHELLDKENRIRDLEEYTDRLLSKIIVNYPELLQIGNNPTSRR